MATRVVLRRCFTLAWLPSVKQLAGLALKQPQVVSVLPVGSQKDGE